MRIDLNADLGESFGAWRMGDDLAMLELVTSASIACGFHAGDPLTIRRTAAAAVERGVVVGAHVSYPDLAGFGRRLLDVGPDDLAADVLYQLGALDAMCRVAGGRVRYVKAHGALYHAIGRDEVQAGAFVAAVAAYDRSLTVLGTAGSVVLRLAAAAGLPTASEAFADRGYAPDGALVPRGDSGDVLTDTAAVVTQALSLARDGGVAGGDGDHVAVQADSLCLHGDTPGAVEHARAVRAALVSAGATLRAFVD